VTDPDEQRAELLDGWDRAAAGWKARADYVQQFGMPVSAWLIDALALQPGESVLELAAGPGDTGFLAAELVSPGGTVISSDGSEAMLDTARERAAARGVLNVEFKQLQLEWIDLPTASVDKALCRWGVMLTVDPAAALREARRVVKPGGRYALSVWDAADQNPWATIPGRSLVEAGLVAPPDPSAPGMFALSAPGLLDQLLRDAGFVEATVDAVVLDRPYESLDRYLEIQLDIARPFREALEPLAADEREGVLARVRALAGPYTRADGSVLFPGRSLVAVAGA